VRKEVPRALFRCDASPEIGAGHVTRCLALAETLAETGWRVAFAVSPSTAAMMPAIAAGGFSAHELAGAAENEPALLRGYYPDGIALLVVDHYQRDIHFEEACRGWARQILVMDDATGRRHDCDFLVDAAASDGSVYKGGIPAQAHLLLGPDYALMRRAFIARRAEALRRRDGRAVENILVSFGATDPRNVTSVALDALDDFADDFSITVALSSRAPRLDEIHRRLRGRMQLALDADMPALMTQADLAIGAAGASSYERAVLGLPSIVVTLADNQAGIAKVLSAAGAAIDAGQIDEILPSRLGSIARKLIADPPGRIRMTQAAGALLDGRGWQRLLIDLAGEARTRDGSSVSLRLAERRDEQWLLSLQRAPQTRRYARNPSVPTVEEHACWMARTLADQNVFLLLIETDGERVGSLRLDRLDSDNPSFEISIAVCPTHHGRGVGSGALSLARRLQPAAVFEAEISPGNTASQKLFERADFRKVGATRYRELPDHTQLAEDRRSPAQLRSG
jgi:UDP-2,4-diacetamido-2,4,6-trideoxy-beta-L-altropyranose hydrolase